MARERRPGAAGQQAEPVAQPGGELLGPEQPHARGRQLDGQREAVQPRADLGHGGRVPVGQRERRDRGPGALDEEADGVVRAGARPATTCSARAGTGRGGTGHTVSPAMLSASRLVARMVSSGQARRSASATRAQASTRCSQLSSTSSSRRGRSASCIVSRRARPASSRTPSAAAIACGTRAASASGASPANHTPSAKAPAVQVARHLKGEPGLADPPGTGQGQQARVPASRRLHRFQLPLPADEAGHGNRHGLAGPVRRGGRKGVREA